MVLNNTADIMLIDISLNIVCKCFDTTVRHQQNGCVSYPKVANGNPYCLSYTEFIRLYVCQSCFVISVTSYRTWKGRTLLRNIFHSNILSSLRPHARVNPGYGPVFITRSQSPFLLINSPFQKYPSIRQCH